MQGCVYGSYCILRTRSAAKLSRISALLRVCCKPEGALRRSIGVYYSKGLGNQWVFGL